MNLNVNLPLLHPGQARIWRERTRLNAVRCGRRWGKTKLITTLSGNCAIKGGKVGIFTPEHKQWLEIYDELVGALFQVKSRSSKTEGALRTITGGAIDFWSVNDNELAGRGREYDLVLGDEMAFTKSNMLKNIWPKAIKPTMLTTRGTAWVMSTPHGDDPDNFFWAACNDPKLEFKEFHAPSSDSPYVPADELEKERKNNHPLVFRQEFLAEFVDFSGTAFFPLAWLLDNGKPIDEPAKVDYVFAVIDTAIKDGRQHDGTACTFFAVNKIYGAPLIVLDWDIISIQGAFLENWLPSVFARLEDMARRMQARNGSVGVWIEDKASGSVLLQQCEQHRWPAQAVPSGLTAAGKSGRAVNISGHVYQNKVRLTRHAHDKVVDYHGASRNHFITQVCGFRVGAKDMGEDDLLDTFTGGVAIALGGPEGF